VKNSGILQHGRSQIPKHHFFAFLWYPSTNLRTAYRRQCLPQTNGTDGKPRLLKMYLLLVWRVCDQAFGRYRPWRVPKSGHVTITKIKHLHVEKFTGSKNVILFDLWRKITKLSRKTRFRTVASSGACKRLAVLNWRSSSTHPSSLFTVITISNYNYRNYIADNWQLISYVHVFICAFWFVCMSPFFYVSLSSWVISLSVLVLS